RKMFQGEDADPEKLTWTWTKKELKEFAPHEPQVGKLVVEGHAIKLPVKAGDEVYKSIEQVRNMKNNKKIIKELTKKMAEWNETFKINIEFYDANKDNISTQVTQIDKKGSFKLKFETETPVEGVKVALPEEHRDGEVNYKLEFLEDTSSYIDLKKEQIIVAQPIVTVNDKVKELIKIRDELASKIKDKSRAFSDWRETNVNYREKLIKEIIDLLDSLKDSANYGLGSSETEYDSYIEEIKNIHILYHNKTSWEEFLNKLSEIINKFWGETG
ncbi:hypothetical protein GOV08_02285, partial [Candidatus Woesearchaeota archaeon]|nr:hypothetical protein [Candidatus Woesearchaeota archaeon]